MNCGLYVFLASAKAFRLRFRVIPVAVLSRAVGALSASSDVSASAPVAVLGSAWEKQRSVSGSHRNRKWLRLNIYQIEFGASFSRLGCKLSPSHNKSFKGRRGSAGSKSKGRLRAPLIPTLCLFCFSCLQFVG